MAFEIMLQTNTSEMNKLNKTLETIATIEGTFRAECSIIDPVILIQANLSDLTGCNYLSITELGRGYFVRDIVSVRAGLVQISAHVDVLSSFAAEIRANKGIVQRAERADSYNLYLNDGSLKAYQDPYILTQPFTAGFTGTAFVLAVAGG